MPALDNARHERFAQELAKGSSQTDAYRAAGYSGDDATLRANASRLIANDNVEARVTELLGRAATRAEITVASISERLLKIAAKAEGKSDAPMLSVARSTLMDVAKLNGLVVDKRELAGRGGGPIEYANLSEDEVNARIAALESGAQPEPSGEA